MKRLLDFFEYICIFIISFLLFILVITLTQVVFYKLYFGLVLDLVEKFFLNFKDLNLTYIILFIIAIIVNYLYNERIVNKLNRYLKVRKEEVNG